VSRSTWSATFPGAGRLPGALGPEFGRLVDAALSSVRGPAPAAGHDGHAGHAGHAAAHGHGHGGHAFGPDGPFGQAFGPNGPFGAGGPFGPGGPFAGRGPWPGFGGPSRTPGRPGPGRRFGGPGHGGPGRDAGPRRGGRARRGDVRAALLGLLAEEPRNGYQLMQEITERSGGTWRPSPGSVYPALSQLEDEGLVAEGANGGPRLLTLTDEGRTWVAEHREEIDAVWAGVSADSEPGDTRAEGLREAAVRLAAAVVQVGQAGGAGQVDAARDVLVRARRDLYRLLAEDGSDRLSADEDADDTDDTAADEDTDLGGGGAR